MGDEEGGLGVDIRELSVGDTFIVESVCRLAESVCTFVVLPAVVVSRTRSFFFFVDVLELVTLPFAESIFVESV